MYTRTRTIGDDFLSFARFSRKWNFICAKNAQMEFCKVIFGLLLNNL